MTTPATEDYLRAVYDLQRETGRVMTTSLARELRVAPASVTSMLKRLDALGLLRHAPYRGVCLTPAGRRLALRMVRRHRLVERFLVDVLGVPWDRVHDEANRWEHVISDDLEERIDRLLGRPATDPHGSPIPGNDGRMPEDRAPLRLSDLAPGQSAVVAEVRDHDPLILRYAASRGLYPGEGLRVVGVDATDGPLRIRVRGKGYAVTRAAADQVLVRGVGPGKSRPGRSRARATRARRRADVKRVGRGSSTG